MKKAYTILIAALLALVLAACGGTPAQSVPAAESTPFAQSDTPAQADTVEVTEDGTGIAYNGQVYTLLEIGARNQASAILQSFASLRIDNEYYASSAAGESMPDGSNQLYLARTQQGMVCEREERYEDGSWERGVYQDGLLYAAASDGRRGLGVVCPAEGYERYLDEAFSVWVINEEEKITACSLHEGELVMETRATLQAGDGTMYVNETVSYLDPETLLIQRLTGADSDMDGGLINEVICTVSYNAGPEMDRSYVDEMLSPEDPREVTLVVDPGLAGERTHQLTLPKGLSVYALTDNGYSVYQDPEGQQPFAQAQEDAKSVTLYFIQGGVQSLTLYIGREDSGFAAVATTLSPDAAPEALLAALAQETGWDLTLADGVTDGKGGMTVCFGEGCSLFTGLPASQKEPYAAADETELAFLILDSIQQTLRQAYSPVNPEALDVYYSMAQDEPLSLPGPGVTLPLAEPYTHEALLALLAG